MRRSLSCRSTSPNSCGSRSSHTRPHASRARAANAGESAANHDARRLPGTCVSVPLMRWRTGVSGPGECQGGAVDPKCVSVLKEERVGRLCSVCRNGRGGGAQRQERLGSHISLGRVSVTGSANQRCGVRACEVVNQQGKYEKLLRWRQRVMGLRARLLITCVRADSRPPPGGVRPACTPPPPCLRHTTFLLPVQLLCRVAVTPRPACVPPPSCLPRRLHEPPAHVELQQVVIARRSNLGRCCPCRCASRCWAVAAAAWLLGAGVGRRQQDRVERDGGRWRLGGGRGGCSCGGGSRLPALLVLRVLLVEVGVGVLVRPALVGLAWGAAAVAAAAVSTGGTARLLDDTAHGDGRAWGGPWA